MNLGLGLFLNARGGGAVFDPTTVANMLIRYRASSAVTSSGGTLIDSIPNEGTLGTVAANQLNFTVARPKYTAASASFGGRPSCLFDGNQALTTPGNFSSSIVQPSTWYAYTRITDTGDSAFTLVRSNAGSTSTSAPLWVRPSTDSVLYAEAATAGGIGSVTSSALYGKRLSCVVYNGASTSLYIDDMTTPVAVAGAGAGTANALAVRIGYGFGVTTADFEFPEQIGYGGAHDAATRAAIKSYFTGTYG